MAHFLAFFQGFADSSFARLFTEMQVLPIILFVLGIIFWVKVKDNFLHGRWEGVDVEHILMSKMTEAGTIDSYNKNQ